MTKIKIRNIIFIIALVLWMLVIFCFSAQPSNDSQNTSDIFTRIAQHIFYPDFKSLSEAEQLAVMSNLSFLVRKTAHFTAYALLGVLAFVNAMSTTKISQPLKPIFAFVFCALYALSDEIHQYFVPGRSCQFRDVCIDSSGALLSILIVFTICKLSKKRKSYKR